MRVTFHSLASLRGQPAQMSFAFAQRWRAGREKRIPSNGAIDIQDWAVEQIGYAEAKAFVIEHHYARSMSTCIAAFGLFHKPRGTVQPARLAGAIVFGVPINNASIPKYAGVQASRGAEITRLILDHDVPGNGESHLTTRAADLLARAVRTPPDARGRDEPRIQAIITFADPMPRTLQDGTVVKRGHFGGVYQATSMTYQGKTKPRWLWLDQAGRVVDERGLQKIRAGERGADYASAQLLAAGAPARNPFETPADWVQRALREGPFRRQRHDGNFAYSWGLCRSGRRAVDSIHQAMGSLPYPKPDLCRPMQALAAA